MVCKERSDMNRQGKIGASRWCPGLLRRSDDHHTCLPSKWLGTVLTLAQACTFAGHLTTPCVHIMQVALKDARFVSARTTCVQVRTPAHLVAQLVWVALVHTFRGEQEGLRVHVRGWGSHVGEIALILATPQSNSGGCSEQTLVCQITGVYEPSVLAEKQPLGCKLLARPLAREAARCQTASTAARPDGLHIFEHKCTAACLHRLFSRCVRTLRIKSRTIASCLQTTPDTISNTPRITFGQAGRPADSTLGVSDHTQILCKLCRLPFTVAHLARRATLHGAKTSVQHPVCRRSSPVPRETGGKFHGTRLWSVALEKHPSPATPYQNDHRLRSLGLLLNITDYKELARLIRFVKGSQISCNEK